MILEIHFAGSDATIEPKPKTAPREGIPPPDRDEFRPAHALRIRRRAPYNSWESGAGTAALMSQPPHRSAT